MRINDVLVLIEDGAPADDGGTASWSPGVSGAPSSVLGGVTSRKVGFVVPGRMYKKVLRRRK